MKRPQLPVVALVATLFILLVPNALTRSVAEESLHTQGKLYSWDSLTKPKVFKISQVGKHIRHKRDLINATGIDSAIFGEDSFDYGLSNGQQLLGELKDIQIQLKSLDTKLESISTDLDSLISGQERLRATSLYGKDVSRLRFFHTFLVDNLSLQDDKSLGPAKLAHEWAENILDLGSDGIAQILHNFNDMVMGKSSLFKSRPIFILMEETLDRDSDKYSSQVREIVDFLHYIQVSGYTDWNTALNIKNRTSERDQMTDMGNNRLTAQKSIIDPLTLEWPSGTYGLPRPNTGCPAASGVIWQTGERFHDTEDKNSNNQWTSDIHFYPGAVSKDNMVQHFCIKSTTPGEGDWPKGNYCIFKKNSCPSGFKMGKLFWDDEDSSNKNRVKGVLPDGEYSRDTGIEYCCRDDGPHSTPILLPTRKPFYLFRYTAECQQVRDMDVREEYFRWDNEDNGNRDRREGAHPFDDGGHRDHRLHYCYYQYYQ